MSAKRTFTELHKKDEKSADYWTAGAVFDFLYDMEQAMERRGVKKAALARKMKVSAAYITKIMTGEQNFTLETMVRIGMALDMELRVHLASPDHSTRWADIARGGFSSVAKAEIRAEEAAGAKASRPDLDPRAYSPVKTRGGAFESITAAA